jgi:tetratricopeptide (TPR) repeat protein
MMKAERLETLADLYEEKGEYPKAEMLFRQVCEMKSQVWGKAYPGAGSGLYGLGLLCYAQDKYEEAESLLLEALSLQHQELGPGHPDVTETLNVLSLLNAELQDRNFQRLSHPRVPDASWRVSVHNVTCS